MSAVNEDIKDDSEEVEELISEDEDVDFLDIELDSLPDLQEPEIFPAGTYRCLLFVEKCFFGEDKDIKCVKFKFYNIETGEKEREKDPEVPEGVEGTILFYNVGGKDEQSLRSQGRLKVQLAVLGKAVKESNVSRILEKIEAGVEVTMKLSTTQGKKKNGETPKTYQNLVEMTCP